MSFSSFAPVAPALHSADEATTPATRPHSVAILLMSPPSRQASARLPVRPGARGPRTGYTGLHSPAAFLTSGIPEPIFPSRSPSAQTGLRGIRRPRRVPGDEMQSHSGGQDAGPRHTLMDGRLYPADRRGPFAFVTRRLFGRRRNYMVDPAYQVRSAVIAVLGMAFL